MRDPDRVLYQATWVNPNGSVVCAGIVVWRGQISEAAPILKKFQGQAFSNLERWINDLGGSIEPVAGLGAPPRPSALDT